MRKLTPWAKALIIALVYSFLFLLPLQLSKVLNDYTFNLAISHLTLSLFIISYDYDLLGKEYRSFSLNTLLGFLLLVATCVIFVVLIILNNYTALTFSDLFVSPNVNNALLQIMELFSIVFCLHLNEAYIFLRFAKLFKAHREFKACAIGSVLYIAFHLLLTYLGGGNLVTSIIYYTLTGTVLAAIHYEHDAIHTYLLGATITILGYIFLF
ncbi:MAG: hypothetical protein IKM20_09325 [Erysipelotrichales bacterium]|nr:hypothetical protein [Erysipelotrichales bacterium]